MNNKLQIICDGDDKSISDKLLASIIEECFRQDKNYKVKYPDLKVKILEFIFTIRSSGIKVGTYIKQS